MARGHYINQQVEYGLEIREIPLGNVKIAAATNHEGVMLSYIGQAWNSGQQIERDKVLRFQATLLGEGDNLLQTRLILCVTGLEQ
jgi:hypothetical protein